MILSTPILEYLLGRFLVSGFVWDNWIKWGRIAHAALPFKLLLGQMVWKFLASIFIKFEGRVRDYLVDLECSILEESVPITLDVNTGDDDSNDER